MQARHFQAAATHVLDLGDLVEYLPHGVEGKIQHHVIDDRARSGHGRTRAQAGEPAFVDPDVAQAHVAVAGVEAGRGVEVAAARSDALAEDENRRVSRHLLGQCFECGFGVGQLTHANPG